MASRLDNLEGKLDKIMTNHLPHIEAEVNGVNVKLVAVTTNQEWLLKFFWIIISATSGSLIVGVLNLILKH